MTLIKDLLTENKFWTFWSSDWSQKVNILWSGKTKWKDVIAEVRKKMNKTKGEIINYERQVQLVHPDLIFD